MKVSGNALLLGGSSGLLRIRPSNETGTNLSLSYTSPFNTSLKKVLLRLEGVDSFGGSSGFDITINGSSVQSPDDTLSLGTSLEYTFSGARTLSTGDTLRLALGTIPAPTTPGEYLAFLEMQDSGGVTTVWTGSYVTIGSGDIIHSIGTIRERITRDPIRNLTNESSYQTGGVDMASFLSQSGGISFGRFAPIGTFASRIDSSLLHLSFEKITQLDCQ